MKSVKKHKALNERGFLSNGGADDFHIPETARWLFWVFSWPYKRRGSCTYIGSVEGLAPVQRVTAMFIIPTVRTCETNS